MRIVQVLAPASFGGLEKVVTGLSSGLAAKGHEVLVLAVMSGETELGDVLPGLGATRISASPA